MATLKKIRDLITPDTAPEFTVPRLADDPEYAAAAALLAAFRERCERLKVERDGRDLEKYLAGRDVDSRSTTDVQLRKRLAAFLALPPIGVAPEGFAPAEFPALRLGLAILAGTPAPAPLDHEARRRELDNQIDTLWAAACEQHEIVEELASRLTLEIATEIKPVWDALQVEMYRAAQELARCARRVREFRSEINSAGVRECSHVLSMPNVRSPLILGDETQWDSEISGWRRILEAKGLI